MGISLKEALKCLCGEDRWSYAVFWKIACRNPSLLVLEECHYKPAQFSALPGISGVDSKELLLKEWEGLLSSPESHSSQFGRHSEDGVSLLINKMMINNPIQVVGEGIVGRAAFTGNHQWILQQNHMQEGCPSEVLTEVHHQFLAGMQTIAVIPALPHGVVQLGSTLVMVENMGFVNDVKSLFVQLGSVPGAPVSDDCTKKEPGQRIGPSTSLGIPTTAGPRHISFSKVEKFTSFIGDSCSQQIPSRASRIVNQPSRSLITQSLNNKQAGALTLDTTPSLNPAMAKCLSDHFQPEALPVKMLNFPLRGQPEIRPVGAQVILSNSEAGLNRQVTSYNPSSGFNHQSTVVQSGVTCSSLMRMEQQLLSDAGLREPDSDNLSTSNVTNKCLLRANEGAPPISLKDSSIFSLLGGSQLPNAGSGLQTLTSIPCSQSIQSRSAGSTSSSYLPVECIGIQFASSCNTGVIPVSSHSNHSNSSNVLSLGSHQRYPSIDEKHTQTEFASGKLVMENDLFQALCISSAHHDDHISRSEPIPSFLEDCWAISQKHENGSSRYQNVLGEGACVQTPSGDDLFDIVGLDIKSEQLRDSWSDFLVHGADASMQNLGTDVSTCITQLGASPDFYNVNDGISNSGIFSDIGCDHLLDAVVSKAQSNSKQNSDDNMSCRTTLTKISSSSVPVDSPTCGQGRLSKHNQVGLFGLPPSHTAAEIVGSSSFKSGCSKDNVRERSQINSIYGSQISLWVEDGQNLKRDNSISTAHSKRPDETGKATRKRLRPGENPRPRPKDRQMIQDRVKELREIVPNGGKCSIDALLERTIKHMLFLQSVTKHADKLKQTGESKIISKEGGLLVKDNFEGGATWAFEVGSQSMVCPIIVEDLNPPRQMLVEMLCEEQGFFLEIADIIRGLGLTILKGVMEARNDKVWARFAVEANRDVTRMEIFLSLVRLLEQTMKSSAAAPKGVDSGNMMVHNAFHQASIPATGWSEHLQ